MLPEAVTATPALLISGRAAFPRTPFIFSAGHIAISKAVVIRSSQGHADVPHDEVDMSVEETWDQKTALSVDYLVCSFWIVANNISVYDRQCTVGEASPVEYTDILEQAFPSGFRGVCRRHSKLFRAMSSI